MTSAPPSYPSQPYPGQPYSGQPYSGQPYSGQPSAYPGLGFPGPGAGYGVPEAPPAQPPTVPPPPPGPGVQPPFPAPPVEGRGRRIGLSLGIGAGVLLLICGGGIAAVIGLAASMSGALDEQAHKAVTQYLDAVHDQQYGKAYAMLCRQAKEDETPAQFQDRVAAKEPIQTYRLGDVDLLKLTVPVDATYQNGDTAQLEAYLGQDRDTGAFEVCDVGE